MNNLKKGDIIIQGDGIKYQIVEVLGDIIFSKQIIDENSVSRTTYDELDYLIAQGFKKLK